MHYITVNVIIRVRLSRVDSFYRNQDNHVSLQQLKINYKFRKKCDRFLSTFISLDGTTDNRFNMINIWCQTSLPKPIFHCKGKTKLTFRVLAILQFSPQGGILTLPIIKLFDTKFQCFSSPPTRHHSFFRKQPFIHLH